MRHSFSRRLTSTLENSEATVVSLSYLLPGGPVLAFPSLPAWPDIALILGNPLLVGLLR
jgi:hypothetical protein